MSKLLPAIVTAAVIGVAGFVPLYLAHAQKGKTATPEITTTSSSTDITKVGYSLGYLMGKGNKDSIPDLDVNSFVKGFKEAYQGKPGNLTEAQMQQVLMDYKVEYDKKQLAKQAASAKTNEEAGKKFLAENAKKASVKTTASGLQYEVVKAGTGRSPKATDTVEVHYEGKLLDGTIFDSSKARGNPISFPLNQVIPGWTEGVQLMKEGAEYRFYIPANLAYGEAGAGNDIPANSTLIFDVELIKVTPSK